MGQEGHIIYRLQFIIIARGLHLLCKCLANVRAAQVGVVPFAPGDLQRPPALNGRLVRRTLSFSKALEMLEASCPWEDWAYNLTRFVKTLRQEVNDENRRWQQRSPAMAAGLTDHIWTVKELLTTVVAPATTNTV